jgi:N-acetylneuraminate synthase
MMVAEIGINHNGDVNLAKKLIDVAVLADCDFVKFQKRTVDAVYPKEELDKYRESPWGTTNREQKLGLEFGQREYDIIDEYCRAKNIGWYASPWDAESVEFLRQYRLRYMKVSSACLTDMDLLDSINSTSADIILSTGMSTKEELDKALSKIGDRTRYILACTSTYPTWDDEINLNFIKTLKEQYPAYKIGFSNHSPGIFYSACSATLGVEMIEFHITLNRAMYGSDQAASIETGGVMQLGKYVRNLEVAMGTGDWTVFESEEKVKKSLRRFK